MKSKKALANFILGVVLFGFGANVVSGATNETDVVARIRSTIASVREEIKYLDDKYSEDDAKWLKYKADVEALFKRCENTLTQDSIDAGTLNKLMDDLNKIDRKLLMKLPAGPQGPGHFGALLYQAEVLFSVGQILACRAVCEYVGSPLYGSRISVLEKTQVGR